VHKRKEFDIERPVDEDPSRGPGWQDDVDVLTLRNRVQVKVLNRDPANHQTDMLVKFPAGYVEPEHTHDSTHAIMVVEGVQVAEGEPMRPGDYDALARRTPDGPHGRGRRDRRGGGLRGLAGRLVHDRGETLVVDGGWNAYGFV